MSEYGPEKTPVLLNGSLFNVKIKIIFPESSQQYNLAIYRRHYRHPPVWDVLLGSEYAWSRWDQTHSSTDNSLSPIPVSDWLIFCCGKLYFIKKWNKNDETTNEKTT